MKMELKMMGFDENTEHVSDVKITTEHEIGDFLCDLVGITDEDDKRRLFDALPNAAEYIAQPLREALESQHDA